MTVTAVVLSKDPVTGEGLGLPAGVVVLNHNETFTTTAGIHAARRRALAKVRTERFFFMDSDDTLPADADSVLAQCLESTTALTYTNERVCTSDSVRTLDRGGYSLRRHALGPLLVHHLALVDTERAKALLPVLPEGSYWFEHLLYFELARTGGVTHVPRVGYNWHRGNGMNRAKGIVTAQVRASTWCYSRLNL